MLGRSLGRDLQSVHLSFKLVLKELIDQAVPVDRQFASERLRNHVHMKVRLALVEAFHGGVARVQVGVVPDFEHGGAQCGCQLGLDLVEHGCGRGCGHHLLDKFVDH